MKKRLILLTSSLCAIFLTLTPALAHVVVKPNQVGIGAYQTFTVGVPNEMDNPTIALRLIIPSEIESVSPNVKPNWEIDVKKIGEGENAKTTEIDWSDGSIPVGQRDEFSFSAKVPASETTISWKAYQTYQDGTIVSWDQDPNLMKDLSDSQKEVNEKKGLGPYSQTKIFNDLESAPNTINNESQNNSLRVISYAALVISLVALSMQLMKKNK